MKKHLCLLALAVWIGEFANLAAQTQAPNLAQAVSTAVSIENLTPRRLGAVRWASQFPGADLGARINAALADGGSNSAVVVDAPGVISTPLATRQGATLIFGPGIYTWSVSSTISANDVKIRGEGDSATIFEVRSATLDLFNVTGERFELSGALIRPSPGVKRTGGSVIAAANQGGKVKDVRLVDLYNGFTLDSQSAGVWYFENVRAESGGGNWNYLLWLRASSRTVADTHLTNVLADWRSAGAVTNSVLVIDTGVDTVEAKGVGIVTKDFPAISLRNSLAGQAPRWIHFVNTFVEAGAAADGIQVQSGTDFRYDNSYIASSKNGLVVSGGVGIHLTNSIVLNNQQHGIVLAGGSDLTIAGCDVSDNSQARPNTFDGIHVAGGSVSDFRILDNRVGHQILNSPRRQRYGILITAGASDLYQISGNTVTGAATAAILDGGTGKNKFVFANLPAAEGPSAASVLSPDPSAEAATGGVSTAKLEVNGSAGKVEIPADGAHIKFTRNSANYIVAAAAGGLINLVGGGASESSPALQITPGNAVAIGPAGTAITRHLSFTYTLNLAAPAGAPGCVDSTELAAPGAAPGDTVVASMDIPWQSAQTLQGFVSSPGKVKLRVCQFSGPGKDPDGAGALYRADIWQH